MRPIGFSLSQLNMATQRLNRATQCAGDLRRVIELWRACLFCAFLCCDLFYTVLNVPIVTVRECDGFVLSHVLLFCQDFVLTDSLIKFVDNNVSPLHMMTF